MYCRIIDAAAGVLRTLADEATTTAVREFVRLAVHRLVAPGLAGRKSASGDLAKKIGQVLREVDTTRFGRQIADAAAWAGVTQVQGMPAPLDTGSATVALDMATVQRRFRSSDDPGTVITERQLVSSSDSFLVLGEPGSGKTTALKRLTLSMFDDIPTDPEAELAFPVVIVCREMNWNIALAHHVAERFGVNLSQLCQQLDASPSEELVLTAELMDQLKCLLVIDGMDEVAPKHRANLLDAVGRLQRLLGVSRIVCSSRSGDEPHLEGFKTAELLALTPPQRAEIAARRLGDDTAFFEAVEQAGIDQGLLDRPLFLNHLMRVFEATGAIADRPSDLYNQLVRLMTHEWDEQRRVRRASKVKGLDATTLDGVLREIAFRLTMEGLAVFNEADIQSLVTDLQHLYALGNLTGRGLLREIQAQAGFISESTAGFQFTHFTLQEHLCAHHVVLRPKHRTIDRMLRQNPEVAAVAVALSSHPTDWLLERITPQTFERGGDIAAFVSRLGQERPRFSETKDLGDRLLGLMAKCSTHDGFQWAGLSQLEAAATSIRRSLRSFHVSPVGDQMELALVRERADADQRRIARYRVPRSALDCFTSTAT